MLEPVTKTMTDDSTETVFRFTFYCDLCGKPWSSVPVSGMPEKGCGIGKRSLERCAEHDAAYERANLEAIQHFNRCPKCKRWVCNDCFLLLHDGDVCRKCAEGKRE